MAIDRRLNRVRKGLISIPTVIHRIEKNVQESGNSGSEPPVGGQNPYGISHGLHPGIQDGTTGAKSSGWDGGRNKVKEGRGVFHHEEFSLRFFSLSTNSNNFRTS